MKGSIYLTLFSLFITACTFGNKKHSLEFSQEERALTKLESLFSLPQDGVSRRLWRTRSFSSNRGRRCAPSASRRGRRGRISPRVPSRRRGFFPPRRTASRLSRVLFRRRSAATSPRQSRVSMVSPRAPAQQAL